MTRFLLLLALVATSASAQTRIFVGNQGAPASISYVDRAANTAAQLPISLSGFLQGMEVINGRLYVTGNGGRIDALDIVTRQRVAQISDPAFATARYFVQAGPTKAYVSTQNYTPGAPTAEVLVLNLATSTVARRITVPTQPEGLALAAGRVYVALGAFGASTTLGVIDAATDALLAPVELGCAPRFVLADDDAEVFALCTDTGEIVVVAGATGAVTQRIAAGVAIGSDSGIGQDGALVRVAGAAEQTLVIPALTGLITVGTDTHAITSRVAIAGLASSGISAVSFDPDRSQFLLGRPAATNPFSANGSLTVHALDGALVATYLAGIFPTHISVVASPTTAGESGPDASRLALSAPVPNPAAGRTEIRISLSEAAEATVAVYDVLGREVARLADGPLPAGETRLQADLAGVPAGVYVVRLVSAGGVATTRLTVAR